MEIALSIHSCAWILQPRSRHHIGRSPFKDILKLCETLFVYFESYQSDTVGQDNVRTAEYALCCIRDFFSPVSSSIRLRYSRCRKEKMPWTSSRTERVFASLLFLSSSIFCYIFAPELSLTRAELQSIRAMTMEHGLQGASILVTGVMGNLGKYIITDLLLSGSRLPKDHDWTPPPGWVAVFSDPPTATHNHGTRQSTKGQCACAGKWSRTRHNSLMSSYISGQ